jgi:hypothetical protein
MHGGLIEVPGCADPLEAIRAHQAALAAIRTGVPATVETIATTRELLGVDRALAFHAVTPAEVNDELDERSQPWPASAT